MAKNNMKIIEADITENQDIVLNEDIPGPLFVTHGSFEGEVYLQWDAIKGANQYAIELAKTSIAKIGGGKIISSWQQVDIISDPHYSITGLRSGRKYSFRYSAIYSTGQGPWSEAVTKIIK